MNKEELERQAASLKAQARAAEGAARLLELMSSPLDVTFIGASLTFRHHNMPAVNINLTPDEADALKTSLLGILRSAADAQIAVVNGSDR